MLVCKKKERERENKKKKRKKERKQKKKRRTRDSPRDIRSRSLDERSRAPRIPRADESGQR